MQPRTRLFVCARLRAPLQLQALHPAPDMLCWCHPAPAAQQRSADQGPPKSHPVILWRCLSSIWIWTCLSSCSSAAVQVQSGGVTCITGVGREVHAEDDAGGLALWAAGLLRADSTASSGEGVSNLNPPPRCCAACGAMGKVSLPDADCCGGHSAHHAKLASDHACLQRRISGQPHELHRYNATTSEVSSMLMLDGPRGLRHLLRPTSSVMSLCRPT